MCWWSDRQRGAPPGLLPSRAQGRQLGGEQGGRCGWLEVKSPGEGDACHQAFLVPGKSQESRPHCGCCAEGGVGGHSLLLAVLCGWGSGRLPASLQGNSLPRPSQELQRVADTGTPGLHTLLVLWVRAEETSHSGSVLWRYLDPGGGLRGQCSVFLGTCSGKGPVLRPGEAGAWGLRLSPCLPGCGGQSRVRGRRVLESRHCQDRQMWGSASSVAGQEEMVNGAAHRGPPGRACTKGLRGDGVDR